MITVNLTRARQSTLRLPTSPLKAADKDGLQRVRLRDSRTTGAWHVSLPSGVSISWYCVFIIMFCDRLVIILTLCLINREKCWQRLPPFYPYYVTIRSIHVFPEGKKRTARTTAATALVSAQVTAVILISSSPCRFSFFCYNSSSLPFPFPS